MTAVARAYARASARWRAADPHPRCPRARRATSSGARTDWPPSQEAPLLAAGCCAPWSPGTHQPARRTPPRIPPERALPRAFSSDSTTYNLAGLLGPALAAMLAVRHSRPTHRRAGLGLRRRQGEGTAAQPRRRNPPPTMCPVAAIPHAVCGTARATGGTGLKPVVAPVHVARRWARSDVA
jgi:hypothetical protein